MLYIWQCPKCKKQFHTDVKMIKCNSCRKNNKLERIE